jgi:hypothetical protein
MPLTRRARRWLVVLGLLALLGLLLAWWIHRQLEPNRLAATVLGRAGKSLQLRFGFSGTPEYALRPEPRLLLPGLTVSGLEGEPFLTARRAEISLPWATITGGEPVITRLQLDAPVLRMDGLARWLASRPKQPFKIPTLTRGLQVNQGTVLGDGFALRNLDLQLPRLEQGEPADITAAGRYEQGTTRADVALHLSLASAGLASAYTLQASGTLPRAPKALAFKLATSGRYASTDALLSVDADSIDLQGDSPLPHLSGKASLRSSDRLRFAFDGLLRDWPAVWPSLPEPLASQTRDLPVHAAYAGRKDLSDAMTLRVAKGETSLEATLQVPALRTWFAASPASPLPPIAGTLRTPVMEFDGVRLDGVEATISPDAPGSTPVPAGTSATAPAPTPAPAKS